MLDYQGPEREEEADRDDCTSVVVEDERRRVADVIPEKHHAKDPQDVDREYPSYPRDNYPRPPAVLIKFTGAHGRSQAEEEEALPPDAGPVEAGGDGNEPPREPDGASAAPGGETEPPKERRH